MQIPTGGNAGPVSSRMARSGEIPESVSSGLRGNYLARLARDITINVRSRGARLWN